MRLLITIFIAVLPLVAAGQGAGTPQYYDYSGGSNTASMPLDNSSNKVQWIYGPNIFRDSGTTGKYCPQGIISTIYFKLGDKASDTSTYSDFLIRLSQNAGTVTSWSGINWTPGLETVFYMSSFKITGAQPDTWIVIPLQKPFFYNPNLSLVVEMSVSAGTGNELRQNRNSGIDQYKWGTSGSSSAVSYGEGLLNFGLDIKPASINDAGITGLISPDKFCPGTRDVYVGIKNFGANRITSLKVNWSVDGKYQKQVLYTDTLDTLNGFGSHVDTILLGSYNFSANTANLRVLTSYPNGKNDMDNSNDTLNVRLETTNADFLQTIECFNQDITFTNTSTGALSYEWRFSDGEIFNTKEVTRKFDTPGFYEVTLVASSPQHCKDSIRKIIHFYPQPIPDFVSNNECVNHLIALNDNSKIFGGGSIVEWEWTIDDSIQRPSGSQVYHTFRSVGPHKVKLKVKTNKGCTDSITKIIDVSPQPVADFTFSSPTCVGTPITFTNKSKGLGMSYLWFLQGKVSLDKDPVHTYSKAKDIDVRLVVTDGRGCTDTMTKPLIVSSPPTPIFDWCIEGETVFFEAKNKGHSEYVWKFGDQAGGMASGAAPSYTYAVTDTYYEVTIIVKDAAGCTDSHIDTVRIGSNDNSTLTNCKTGIEDSKSLVRLNLYPNPFSHKTLIEYELLKSQQVRVSVWDATGKQIAVLSEGLQQPGMQQLTLDANEHKLSTGLYMIRIETEGMVAATQVLRLE